MSSSWNKLYENDKMIVHTDSIDTVSVNNKHLDVVLVLRVVDEDGFNVAYQDDGVNVDILDISGTGEVSMVLETDIERSEDEEE
jgi:hypothetical protein